MNLNDPRDLLWIAGICYGISFFVGMLKTFRFEVSLLNQVPVLGIALGFLIQTRALYLRGLEVHGCPLGNTLERIQFILWSLILAFLILRFIWRLNLLGTFCAGLAMGAGFLSLILPGSDPPYWTDPDYLRLFSNPWVELHASIAIFSYGLFSLLAIVSGMYLVQRNALLSRKHRLIGSFLPPIHDLEHAGFRLLTVGTSFLTLSIIVGGMHWTRHPEFVTTTKLYVTLLLWFGYAILFFLRFGNRLYGSKFAKASIALFCLAILSLSFVNSKSKKQESHVVPSSDLSLAHSP